jgi:hypothetical protein
MSEGGEVRGQLPWIKSPDGIIEIYANMMHATWTLDDLRIRIGQVIDSPETPNPGKEFKGVVQETAAVTFGWRNAKLLRDQLSEVIELYEKVNGEINIEIILPSGE